MDCENLSFSRSLHQQRIARAESLFGPKVVRKILGYALFLLGAKRSVISATLGMAAGSLRSLILAMNNRGLSGFEDQRCRTSSFKPPAIIQAIPSIEEEGALLKVNFGVNDFALNVPAGNTIQKRVVLLTLLNDGNLTRLQVADALNLSADRVGKLAAALQQQDVTGILDQRQGQQQDYRFSPEVKAELIQQFVIDIVGQGHTSGEQLARNLNERCDLELSPRSILHHLSKMGLSKIKSSLPDYLATLKKTSPDS
jgi:hypothetical protein